MNWHLLKKENRDSFIKGNLTFIKRTAQNICKRTLNIENDDELSIALISFNKACNSYDESKGDFFKYAYIIIRNGLIDYFRKNKKTPYLTFDTDEETFNYIDYKNSMISFLTLSDSEKRIEEINLFNKELSFFNISFSDLVKYSPSHKDTRQSLLKIALLCSKNEEIITYIKDKKKLPIKKISLLTNNNRKLIENWKRYILALIIIISNDDYLYLRHYLNIKIGGNNFD